MKLLNYQVWEAVTMTASCGNTSATTYHLSQNLLFPCLIIGKVTIKE